MKIIEQALIPKSPKRKSEDGIVITDDFIAVIDGSTSKSSRQLSLFRSNGRYCMQLVAKYIRRMPKTTTCTQFCRGVSAYIRKHYSRRDLPRLTEHPEDRICASVVVFSRLQREIWMIGDCQCMIMDVKRAIGEGQYFDNPKPAEAELAKMRAEEVCRQLEEGKAVEELLRNDTARPVIIPRMLETMQQQNITYSVVDGFPIPQQHVRIITLDFQPWEIVLASDGYPFLCPTLEESEEALKHQRDNDPLNIGPHFQATKAFHSGNNSFDDRAYIRFSV